MPGRLQDKRALIYGGGTGIGLACAEAMAARSGHCLHLQPPARGAARSDLKLAAFGRAGFEPGDATSVEDVQRVTAAARAFMGGIDTIVVSAGAGGRTSVFDTEPAEFQRIVDHTLRPAFLPSAMRAPISSRRARDR